MEKKTFFVLHTCALTFRLEMRAFWKELKEWRKHWSPNKFFQALVFGLLFSVLDMETDFVFAWSVPDECPTGSDALLQRGTTNLNHCGHFVSKGVKYCTFTFIALPGVMLAFSALQSLFVELWDACSGPKVPGYLQAVMNVVALTLQTSLCIALNIVPVLYPNFDHWFPELMRLYDRVIPVMAYSTATFVIGVKLLAVFSHGPETTRLVEKATDAEVRYEAALQLILLGTIYLVSGKSSLEITNSAVTSLLVIGKLGVQDFFKNHDKESTKASLIGKVCIAISVAPVFVLVAIFKIGCLAIVFALWTWSDYLAPVALILLAVAPPALLIYLVKICVPHTNLTAAAITEGVFAELVSLHHWQCERLGKKIGIGMITYNLILYSAFLDWIIVNPSSRYDLRVEIYVCLRLGWVCFVLIALMVLYQEKYVTYMVSKHPRYGREQKSEDK